MQFALWGLIFCSVIATILFICNDVIKPIYARYIDGKGDEFKTLLQLIGLILLAISTAVGIIAAFLQFA